MADDAATYAYRVIHRKWFLLRKERVGVVGDFLRQYLGDKPLYSVPVNVGTRINLELHYDIIANEGNLRVVIRVEDGDADLLRVLLRCFTDELSLDPLLACCPTHSAQLLEHLDDFKIYFHKLEEKCPSIGG